MRKSLALVAAVAVLLTSCSSGDDDPEADPSGSATEGATAEATGGTEEPAEDERDLRHGTVLEPLSEWQPRLIGVIKEERTFPVTHDFLNFGGVVFGDEVALMSPETQLLTAVSLETGKRIWKARLPKHRGKTEPLCPLAQLPPDATAGVVMLGLDCGIHLRYDLETGKLLGKEVQKDFFDMPHTNATFELDRHTFWIDVDNNLRRFGPDGTSELVMAAEQLGLKESENVFDAMPIWGSDVVALDISDYDGPTGAAYDGRWIGLRLPAEGRPEVAWSVRERAAFARAEPGGRLVGDGHAAYSPSYGGSLETVIMKGIRTPRLNRFDPETGALDSGLVLRRDPPGGFPAWADSLGDSSLLPVEDGLVAASGDGGFAGFAHITFYDYTTGKIRWTFTKEYPHVSPQSADPVGMTSDGTSVYAMIWADRARLVELDMETGRLQRTWTFPDSLALQFSDAEVYIEDDLMVWLRRFSASSKEYAATFRLG